MGLSSIGTAVGSAFGGPVGGAIGGIIGGSLDSRRAKKKSNQIANTIIPSTINTGNSMYSNGVTTLDPSIRRMQDSYVSSVGDRVQDVNNAYGEYRMGLRGIQSGVDDLRSSYEGNQSAYRDAMLNPVKEALAKREGALDKELSRTNVRGSFRNQSKTNLAIDSARTISDAEAKIENDRINKLGDFLNMDADILKQGLASDTGRINMLNSLEESLSGISMDRFNQEMSLLRLPATFVSGTTQKAALQTNTEGRSRQFEDQLLGDVFESIGNTNFGNVNNSPSYDPNELYWE